MASTITEKAISEEQGADAEAGGNDGGDRHTYLSELVGELPRLELYAPHNMLDGFDGRVPGFREIAQALVTDKLVIGERVRLARQEVGENDWGNFQFLPDDFTCAQRVAIGELDDAVERLEEVTVALLRWLQVFQRSRVVQLDEASWPALRALAVSAIPPVMGEVIAMVVQAAVEHLLKRPDAAEIIAEAEQRRLKALYARSGRELKPGDYKAWPWRTVSGKPWPAPEPTNNGSTAKGQRRPSRGANSTAKNRVRGSGRPVKAA